MFRSYVEAEADKRSKLVENDSSDKESTSVDIKDNEAFKEKGNSWYLLS